MKFIKIFSSLFALSIMCFALLGMSSCKNNSSEADSSEKTSKESKKSKKQQKPKKVKQSKSKSSKKETPKKKKKDEEKESKKMKKDNYKKSFDDDDEDDDDDKEIDEEEYEKFNEDIAFLDSLNSRKNPASEDVEEQIKSLLAKLKAEEQLLSNNKDFDQPYQAILFDTASSCVSEDQLQVVQANVSELIEAAKNGEKIIIRGHADMLEHHDEAQITELAKKRADAVKAELISKGVPSETIEVKICGAKEPLVFGFNAEKQELENRANRRVEIWTT